MTSINENQPVPLVAENGVTMALLAGGEPSLDTGGVATTMLSLRGEGSLFSGVSDLRRYFPELLLNVPSKSFALLFEVSAQEQAAEPIDIGADGDHQVGEIGADCAN